MPPTGRPRRSGSAPKPPGSPSARGSCRHRCLHGRPFLAGYLVAGATADHSFPAARHGRIPSPASSPRTSSTQARRLAVPHWEGGEGFLPQLRIGIPLGAGSCAGCVDDERDSILEGLLARYVDDRDVQLVAADTEIGG
jgi:hypothetical protein